MASHLRANLTAHFLHAKMREGYYMEKATSKKDGKGNKDGKSDIAKLDGMLRAMRLAKKPLSIPGVEIVKVKK